MPQMPIGVKRGDALPFASWRKDGRRMDPFKFDVSDAVSYNVKRSFVLIDGKNAEGTTAWHRKTRISVVFRTAERYHFVTSVSPFRRGLYPVDQRFLETTNNKKGIRCESKDTDAVTTRFASIDQLSVVSYPCASSV